MKNSKILYLIPGFVIGIILAVGAFALLGQKINQTPHQNTLANSDVMDAHFIEQMIPHHEDAITMSEIALEKAESPEVRELAKNIIDSQTEENDLMREWYGEWFSRKLPRGDEVMQHHGMGSSRQLHMGITGTSADILNLENSEDFDRKFIEHMVPHHQMAVMMASMLKDGSTRPEMKKLADDIISAQTSEIDLMRGWLEQWN
jgi:uncharacterized protein (DUF305 family)